MISKRQKRMVAVAVLVAGLALTAVFGFTAFRKNMMYFYTPTDIVEHHVADNAQLRLGGLVTPGSVKRGDGLQVDFTLADCVKSLPVRYEGILPDRFKVGDRKSVVLGQGVSVRVGLGGSRIIRKQTTK